MEKPMKHLQNKKGAALITMLLFLVVLTVIGLTSVSITSLENLTAMNERIYEDRMNDQEAGVEPQVDVLETTIFEGALPADYQMPSGPVPVSAAPTLPAELITELIEADDVALVGALGPDLQIILPDLTTVNTDIDFRFTKFNAGSAVEANAAYEGIGNAAASGGTQKVFQMTSQSTLNSPDSAITNSYICVVSGSCQK